MRALFIGGTGTISMAISRLLVEQGWELYLLNRGSRKNVLDGQAKQIVADISKEQEVAEKIAGMNFDVVCDFIGFVPEQVERDYRLFAGKTKQYMYISLLIISRLWITILQKEQRFPILIGSIPEIRLPAKSF